MYRLEVLERAITRMLRCVLGHSVTASPQCAFHEQYLIDENLPVSLAASLDGKVVHASEVRTRVTDRELWDFALQNSLAIVTRDADFLARVAHAEPAPWVVLLRVGNMERAELRSFLSRVWPTIMFLLDNHKLVTIYADRLEALRH
jgi:predicted nuclease of predicted toxin-antitoxin system